MSYVEVNDFNSSDLEGTDGLVNSKPILTYEVCCVCAYAMGVTFFYEKFITTWWNESYELNN